MAGRLRRTVVAVTLVVLLLPLAAATSLADTAPPGQSGGFSRSGFQAIAAKGDCTSDGDISTCTSSSVTLFSGKTRDPGSGAVRGTEVCYDLFKDTFDVTTGEFLSSIQEFGCTRDVGQGSSIERDLSSATIAPTTINLETFVCDQNGCNSTPGTDVTVEGTFTATSAAIRSSFREVFDDGFCTSRTSFRGTSRGAMFSGTIDGQSEEFGDPDGFAEIGRGTNSSRFSCREGAA